MPRTLVIARKGGGGGDAPISSADQAPDDESTVGQPSKENPTQDGEPDTDDTGAPVTCPNCGCEFDPATGEITNDPGAYGGQGAATSGPPAEVVAALQGAMGGGGGAPPEGMGA